MEIAVFWDVRDRKHLSPSSETSFLIVNEVCKSLYRNGTGIFFLNVYVVSCLLKDSPAYCGQFGY
jgi:hypothetical protein